MNSISAASITCAETSESTVSTTDDQAAGRRPVKCQQS